MKDDNLLPESLKAVIERNQKIAESISPIIEQNRKWHETITPIIEHKSAFQEVALQQSSLASAIIDNPTVKALESIDFKSFATELSGFAVGALTLGNAMSAVINEHADEIKHIATGITSLVNSPVMAEIRTLSSAIGTWLRSVDFSPLTSIIQSIKDYGFALDSDDVDEIYLSAMFDARWFPYAAWIADIRMIDEIFEILDTSRASNNRTKKMDRLIFSYYDKEELMSLKRRWRQMNLPSYMIRILIQSVQAYNRREYALTVSALSTLWEGIIQEKVNDNSYRISRKTRENLDKLIQENKFDMIFTSFCDEFIFYNCTKPEEVKPDVPGRHGIAHCWYDSYPNRKVALNAILFTDFLLNLKPLDKQEDNENGQVENALDE